MSRRCRPRTSARSTWRSPTKSQPGPIAGGVIRGSCCGVRRVSNKYTMFVTSCKTPVRLAATVLDCLGQDVQHSHRIVPAETGVRDALAVFQRTRVVLARRELLGAGLEMAFDHHPEDGSRAPGHLLRDIARDIQLLLVLLAAVRVAAVDHQHGRQLRRL